MMVRIELGKLHVDEVTNSSGVFSGDNYQVHWRAYSKSNQGYGTLDGEYNHIKNNKSAVLEQKNERKTLDS